MIADIQTLIAAAQRQGYHLIDKGDILRVEPLPPEPLLSDLRAHKQEILTALRGQVPPPNPPPSPKSHDRRKIALVALQQLEPDAGVRARVWRAAEQQEKNWKFLVREHGYPVGWFILVHVDAWLRQHHGKGITTEGPGDEISAWWMVDVLPEPILEEKKP